MLLCLYVVLTGYFCHSFTDFPKMTVLQNTMAELPCPHTKGDVSWSRLRNGDKVLLVSTENGSEKRSDKRFGSLADNSLVIGNVKPSDSGMYFCNRSRIYLAVTTDPIMVTPSHDGGDQKGTAPAGDADTGNQSLDLWQGLAAVVVGAALVLLAILTKRLCSKKREETNMDEVVIEEIYEEIGEEQVEKGPDVENPYYWTSMNEIQNTSTPPHDLYSTVNKLKTEGGDTTDRKYQ